MKSEAWKHRFSTGIEKPGRAIGLVRTLTLGTYQGKQAYKYKCPEAIGNISVKLKREKRERSGSLCY